jgi:DNA repair exonuclease SbcCD ATPase subunit
MLTFKKVKYKNFQSIGNAAITIDLDRSPTTCIGGHNGAGKSSLLEAISYGLFGKSLKKVTLSQLINTINKKNMVVEIEFEKNGKSYKVVRGQKPAVFEFWIDNELQDQSAASKDYQAKVEYVLGMDFKLFTQIVVLNKEKYVPFMELGAADRRKVVEDILDISVFSVMSDLLKKVTSNLNTEIEDLKYERERLDERMRGQQRLIDEAASNVDGQIAIINETISTLGDRIEGLETECRSYDDELETLKDIAQKVNDASKTKRQFEDVAVKFQSNITDLQKTAKFFEDNDVCPTCSQAIDDATKASKHTECNDKVSGIKASATSMVEHYQKAVADLTALVTAQQREQTLRQGIRQLESEMQRIRGEIRSNVASVQRLSAESKVDQYVAELTKTKESHQLMTDSLNGLKLTQEAQSKCKELLKDDGIKASIVRDYIEFINNRLNEYLGAMDFHLNLSINEKFEDKINAINREGFTYDNLSTGQKCRVNLALWLALLEVASIKNSVVTNILFLDEILEPIDREGVGMFMKLVREKLPHKNTFVVTQRFDEFKDHFRSELSFRLNEGFTEIV